MLPLSIMTRVLLFCGAFDPITTGHMMMLDLCINTAFFNEIRIMPSGVRLDKNYKTDDSHRRKMIEISMKVFKQKYPSLNLIFSDYEMNLKEPQDSYFTVKHFNDTEPENEFYFFMGSDILPQMFDWPYSNDLINATKFLIAYRKDYNINQDDLKRLNNYELLDNLLERNQQQTRSSPASSTEARKELGEGKKCGDLLLHPDVMEYVQKNGLYQSAQQTTST